MDIHETDVLIIGGGVTGAGVMRDLALRGIPSILVDKSDLDAGASGGNHGLLHSGGRYAAADTGTAAECLAENMLLKRLAAHCIDDCGGFFIAVEGDDPAWAEAFPAHCAAAGIPCGPMAPDKARQMEPALPETVTAAYAVPDAAVDPFRLTLSNVQHARDLTDSRFLPHIEVTGFDIVNGRITAALCRDARSGRDTRVIARQFVNAGGAWAMKIARMAGCDDVRLFYSKGTLIITDARLTSRVINRLRPPGDGDILVPGGTVSVLGTSSVTVNDPDAIRPTVSEVDHILHEGTAMLPALEDARFIRAYCGVRPLLQSAGATGGGRKASRGFMLFDHEDQGLSNFATIAGGTLTTFRLMAEKTGDLVAARLGVSAPCRTAREPLPSPLPVSLTDPGFAAREWFRRADPKDMILCECEMAPQSVVDAILKDTPGAEDVMSLRAIAMRSRIGKGACQGAFCSMRVTSYLYDKGVYDSPAGLALMSEFAAERFKGVRPVLWGRQVPQMELAEILHRGLMGLDLPGEDGDGAS